MTRAIVLAFVVVAGACAKRAPDEPNPPAKAAPTASATVTASATEPEPVAESVSAPASKKPVRCGSKMCWPGQVCCNPLMETCAAPGACPH